MNGCRPPGIGVETFPMRKMAIGGKVFWYLAAIATTWVVGTNGVGTDDGLCVDTAQGSGFSSYDRSFPGTVVLKVPYHWCTAFCPGWSRFPVSDVELVLLQFILPTVIFALVIPRKWHLDLSPTTFDFGDGLLRGLIKAMLSLIATGVVASSDMILWIGVILALAGPMILSGVEEVYLDYISVRTLATSHRSRHHQLTSEQRLSILVAVLCGNFDGDSQMVTDLQTSLSTFANAATLETRKAQLESIMNGQANFGSVVGIPAVFFLAGLLYNAYQIADQTATGINWTPYAIWLMTMVYVVLISAAPLTGSNPSVATMLVRRNYHLQDRPWWNIVANYYGGEISPVPMYDRATTKLGWVKNSTAYQNHNWFKEKIKHGGWTWALLVVTTGFTTLFASIMAFAIAHNIPWAREGCHSFSYVLYIALQAFLIILRLISRGSCQPLFSIPSPTAYNTSSTTWFKTWQVMYSILLASAFALAFFISFAGSIFQIFGVYNNCFCHTAVSSWGSSADRREVQLAGELTQRRKLENKHYVDNITVSAVVVTGVLCYLGWWYQKVLRRAVAVELERL